jgi:hypothetical protein
LGYCWTGISNREEEFGIFVTTGGLMSPVHGKAPLKIAIKIVVTRVRSALILSRNALIHKKVAKKL